MTNEEFIKRYISSLTLEELRSTEMMVDDNTVKDIIKVCESVFMQCDVYINPVQAYWLWSEYSSDLSAQWLDVNCFNMVQIKALIGPRLK